MVIIGKQTSINTTYGDLHDDLDHVTLKIPAAAPLQRVLPAMSASRASTEHISGVSYSPRLLLSRWFHRQPRGSSGGGGDEEEGPLVGCRVRFPRPPCTNKNKKNKKKKNTCRSKREESDNGSQQPLPESSTSINMVRKPDRDGMPLNFGSSVALVFLLARGASEINKISEKRMQMELLLADIKAEIMKRTNAVSSFIESNISNSSAEDQRRRSSSLIAKDQVIEVESKSKGCSSSEDSSSVISHVEEIVTEPKQEDMSKLYGVSPRELERRLHELLEEQQQERIQKLESMLERAERRIREKDIELRWWRRDSAKLAT